MCTNFNYNDGTGWKALESVGAVKMALDVNPEEIEDDAEDDQCLCWGIDEDAVVLRYLHRGGYRAEYDPLWSEWSLEKLDRAEGNI